MLIAAETLAAVAPYASTGTDEARLPQRAYQALRQAICDLRLTPGQMVLEKDAAGALGISRTPVREALVRLDRARDEIIGIVQAVSPSVNTVV